MINLNKFIKESFEKDLGESVDSPNMENIPVDRVSIFK